MGDESVNEHVAGASIEREDFFWRGRCGHDGDVGDAADVQGDAAEFFVAVEGVVGEGNEWCSLTAESDVGGTEIADRGDAGEICNDGAVADLEGGGGRCSEEFCRCALVEDGLAVVADKGNLSGRNAELFAGG